MAANIAEVSFITFPGGIFLLTFPANDFATVPETITPKTPMVSIYTFLIHTIAGLGNSTPKFLGIIIIIIKKLENIIKGIVAINPSLIAII